MNFRDTWLAQAAEHATLDWGGGGGVMILSLTLGVVY